MYASSPHRTALPVPIVPAPAISRAPCSSDTARHVSSTVRRSSGVSVAVSPVVPSATRPSAPFSRQCRASRSRDAVSTSPDAVNGVTSAA